jgi:hypothetical protein
MLITVILFDLFREIDRWPAVCGPILLVYVSQESSYAIAGKQKAPIMTSYCFPFDESYLDDGSPRPSRRNEARANHCALLIRLINWNSGPGHVFVTILLSSIAFLCSNFQHAWYYSTLHNWQIKVLTYNSIHSSVLMEGARKLIDRSKFHKSKVFMKTIFQAKSSWKQDFHASEVPIYNEYKISTRKTKAKWFIKRVVVPTKTRKQNGFWLTSRTSLLWSLRLPRIAPIPFFFLN